MHPFLSPTLPLIFLLSVSMLHSKLLFLPLDPQLNCKFNVEWKNKGECKQLYIKKLFVVSNPKSAYKVSLFLKIKHTAKQIVKFISQALFFRTNNLSFITSPRSCCFAILNFS